MKIKFIILFALTCTINLYAQSTSDISDVKRKSIQSELSIDLLSQYIWRGLYNGKVSIQPTLGLEYRGLSLSAWGNIGFDDKDPKEIDLTLAYSAGGFHVGVIDYWFGKGNYFCFSNDETTHVFEANIGYDFDFLSVDWYTNFAGDDGTNSNEERAYSSYFELTAPFQLASLDWEATVGAVPYATSYYETEGFAVTNLSLKATKEIPIGKSFRLPVFAVLTFNPCAEKAYMACGITANL